MLLADSQDLELRQVKLGHNKKLFAALSYPMLNGASAALQHAAERAGTVSGLKWRMAFGVRFDCGCVTASDM
jgi:hypothetical protein